MSRKLSIGSFSGSPSTLPFCPRCNPTTRRRSTQLCTDDRSAQLNEVKKKTAAHSHIRPLQTVFEDTRHTAQHVQALGRQRQDLLSGLSSTIDGRRGWPSRGTARLPGMSVRPVRSTHWRRCTRSRARSRRGASFSRAIAVRCCPTLPSSGRTRCSRGALPAGIVSGPCCGGRTFHADARRSGPSPR